MSEARDISDLARLDRCKRRDDAVGDLIGGAIVELYERQIERRQSKLAQVAEVWAQLVPPGLQERSCLESLHKGRLGVLVDSAPHLYEFKQVLLAGLERRLLVACRAAGVRRIALKRGRWYDAGGEPIF